MSLIYVMNIGLIAHDSRKKELLEWVKYNTEVLKKHNLYATGTTGRLIKEVSYLDSLDEDGNQVRGVVRHYPLENSVVCLKSGPLGGDQQMGAMIAEGKIDVLIFFCDNLITQGHQQDVGALVRLASLYNIAFATNRTTADFILTSSLMNDPGYKKILPDAIKNYENRSLE